MLVLERGENEWFGSIEYPDAFFLSTVGSTIKDVIDNIKMLIGDFISHEGKDHPEWKDVNVEEIEFEEGFDLTSFFEAFDALKISKIAELSEINPSLLRQYVSGSKYPSRKQALKIQTAIKALGERLTNANVV